MWPDGSEFGIEIMGIDGFSSRWLELHEEGWRWVGKDTDTESFYYGKTWQDVAMEWIKELIDELPRSDYWNRMISMIEENLKNPSYPWPEIVLKGDSY